jgi:hypothetical protein
MDNVMDSYSIDNIADIDYLDAYGIQTEDIVDYLHRYDEDGTSEGLEPMSKINKKTILALSAKSWSYFERIGKIASNVQKRFSYMSQIRKSFAICFDTDIVAGAIHSDSLKRILKLNSVPNISQAIGPSLLSYLLNSTNSICIPYGTVVELEYISSRILKKNSPLLKNLRLSKSRRGMHRLKSSDIVRILRSTDTKEQFNISLRSLERETSYLPLLQSIETKANTFRASVPTDPDFDRMLKEEFDVAFQYLSSIRPDSELNNFCNSLNIADVFALTKSGFLQDTTGLPFLVTTTEEVLQYAESQSSRLLNIPSPVVRPVEISLFMEIANLAGWPRDGYKVYERAVDKLGQSQRQIEDLCKSSKGLLMECERFFSSEDKSRRLRAKTEVISMLERIQVQYSSFLSGHNGIFMEHTDRKQYDSLHWLGDIASDEGLHPVGARRKVKNEDVANKVALRIRADLCEYDIRSRLQQLNHALLDADSVGRDISRTINWFVVKDLEVPFNDIRIDSLERIEDDISAFASRYMRGASLNAKIALENLANEQRLRIACFSNGCNSALFLVDFGRLTGEQEWFIDIAFVPGKPTKDVWDIESTMFRLQLNHDLIDEKTIATERVLHGEFEHEDECVVNKHDGPRVRSWDALTQKFLSNNKASGANMNEFQYMDILTSHLTFYIQNSRGHRNEHIAGLIATMPINKAQLRSFASLLHKANRFNLSEAFYAGILNKIYDSFGEKVASGPNN